MILVEIDESLAAGLRERFSEHPQVTVATADARGVQHRLRAGDREGPLQAGRKPSVLCRVADRTSLPRDRSATRPHGSDGPAGSCAWDDCAPRRNEPAVDRRPVPCRGPVRDPGSARAFSPPPNVHSAVVRMARRTRPPIDVDSPAAFFSLARAGFAAPRKTLANSLALGLRLDNATVSEFLTRSQLDPARRPATLSLEEWGSLYQAWKESGRPGLEQVRKAPAIHDGRR